MASHAKRTVAIRTLATLLGVKPDELRTVAAESGLAVRRQIAWDDVERLDLKAIARLRAAEHRSRVSLRTSRNWVAGYPRLLREWDVDRNIGVYPWQVSRGSSRRFWWRCPEGPDHVWRTQAIVRTRGAGCPFCKNQRVSVTNSLATFAPEIAAEWHPTHNGAR